MEDDTISINFKALWQVLWKEKWWIVAITTVFTIIGGIYAFSLKEEYLSEGKILPEVAGKSGGLGQYAGLAALAGVDIGSATTGGDAIRPDLYPDVLKSTPFFLSLFKTEIKNRKGEILNFEKFYNGAVLDGELKPEDQKLKFQESDQYVVFNMQTEKNILDLKKRISCSYDKKTGVISITVKMPDPVVAARIAKYSMDYLTDYIVNYRTEKQKKDLDFLANRLLAAKGKYYNTQERKASYSDAVPLESLRMKTADLQRERIESEYKISSGFYNTLLQKYEEAKLKMQQETPVIKVLEPPVVPNLKSEPKKSIIIAGGMVLSGFLALIFALMWKRNYRLVLQ